MQALSQKEVRHYIKLLIFKFCYTIIAGGRGVAIGMSILSLVLVVSATALFVGLVCLWRKHSALKLSVSQSFRKSDVEHNLQRGESNATTTTASSNMGSMQPQSSVQDSITTEVELQSTEFPEDEDPLKRQDISSFLISKPNQRSDTQRVASSIGNEPTSQKEIDSISCPSRSRSQPLQSSVSVIPAQTNKGQPSISEPPAHDTQPSVQADGVTAKSETCHQEEHHKADRSEKQVGVSNLLPTSPSHPTIKRFFGRSQSLYPSSPPEALLTSYEHGSVGRRLSDLLRKPSLSTCSKKQDETPLLSGNEKNPKFTVGGEEEEHEDES